jgi:hypothetical protein
VDQLHPNEAALAVRETCPSIVLVLLQSSIIMPPRKNVNLEDGTKPPGEKFAVDSVAIADDVAWCPFPAAGFDELSGHPFSARVCRYVEP